MNEAEATNVMAQALTARGIAFAPSEAEAAHLGVAYVAPVAAPVAAPADSVPAAKPPTVEEQIASLTAPNLGNEQVDAAIEQTMQRPADPNGYTLPALDKDQAVTPEITAAFDGYKAGLHEFGFAAPIGNKIAEMVNAAALRGASNPIQTEHARQAANTTLSRTWGADAPARIAAVQAEVQRVLAKHPHLRDAVELVGNDPHVVMMIHNTLQARRAA